MAGAGCGAPIKISASAVELIELKDHPWFLACQFHPEFHSKPNHPHPLFKGFVKACLAHGN